MAVTTAYSGSHQVNVNFQCSFSGDRDGSEAAAYRILKTWAAAGGTAPTISGFLKGTLTAAAGDILLAHATDPLQSMGDAGYSEGFTVAGTKLKFLYIENLDSAESITITRKASTGLPIFDAAGDAITLAPTDHFLLFKRAGTAALTSGSNDALTISVSGGAPTATIIAAYGP